MLPLPGGNVGGNVASGRGFVVGNVAPHIADNVAPGRRQRCGNVASRRGSIVDNLGSDVAGNVAPSLGNVASDIASNVAPGVGNVVGNLVAC